MCTLPTHTSWGCGFARAKKNAPPPVCTSPASCVGAHAHTLRAASASASRPRRSSTSRGTATRHPSQPAAAKARRPTRPSAAAASGDTSRKHAPEAPSSAGSTRLTRTYGRSASSSAHSASNSARFRRDTSTSMLPPHDSPTSWARAVEAWKRSRLACCDPSRQSSAVWMTLPSMQPPDTDPAMPPRSLTAITDPGTRGEDPQVFVT